MEFIKELDIYLRSRFTLISIRSFEEERVLEKIKYLCEKSNRSAYVWDHADFFQCLTENCSSNLAAKDPLTLLEAIDKLNQQGVVFVLRDFHQCLSGQPRIIRKLRSIAQKLKYTRKTIVILTPLPDLPEELKDDLIELDFPLPDANQLSDILERLLSTPGTRTKISPHERKNIIKAALGLSSNQAQRIFAKAIVSNGVLEAKDVEMVMAEKQSIVKKSSALELFSPNETLNDVGGLEVLKGWLQMRRTAFSTQAKDYGLPAPRGIALIGIPGTGKSLTAKMIANLWELALIRLDVGALFGTLVGQSEDNTRQALKLVETVAPCVLWIDEIEKGLSTSDGDGGTTMRVFATLLSWMQEKTKPVFIVATANNIAMLPPELLRRGRFDEIFFLDLPIQAEREEIFKVHIGKRKRNPQDYDITKLAGATSGFVGAEIEQAIIDAMYLAFNDTDNPAREFTTDDILKAVDKLVPLSKSQREVVDALRHWLVEGRAQSASFKEIEQAKEEFVDMQLEPLGKIL